MNSTAAKIVAVLISLFMIAYVGYQAFLSFYDPYETEVVKKEQYIESVQLNGFFVRDEQVIPTAKTGVIGYNYKNAQKISKNSIVANVYSDKNDLYNLKKIELLKKQKAILEEAQNEDSSEGLKLDLLSKQISEGKLAIVQAVDENDLSALDNTVNELMLNIDKFNHYVSSSTYDEAIASIDSRIERLSEDISPVQNTVKAEQSGYFSNTVDGFETKFTPDMLSGLTISDVSKALEDQKKTSSDKIGKILPDDSWHFVSLVSAKDAELFLEGRQLSLKFSSQSVREVPATVRQVITEKGASQAAVVFESDYLDENFVTMRFEKPQAIIKNYTGIVIPKEAIRVRTVTNSEGKQEERTVVYTLLGKTVRYRFVEPIYEDEYVLISKVMNDSKYVSIYDQVIIKGKNLNDAVE